MLLFKNLMIVEDGKPDVNAAGRVKSEIFAQVIITSLKIIRKKESFLVEYLSLTLVTCKYLARQASKR